jgi:hypothetical protein
VIWPFFAGLCLKLLVFFFWFCSLTDAGGGVRDAHNARWTIACAHSQRRQVAGIMCHFLVLYIIDRYRYKYRYREETEKYFLHSKL